MVVVLVLLLVLFLVANTFLVLAGAGVEVEHGTVGALVFVGVVFGIGVVVVASQLDEVKWEEYSQPTLAPSA